MIQKTYKNIQIHVKGFKRPRFVGVYLIEFI